jgi:DNA-directed RNA polymerase specialized sigma24 family protein
MDAHPDDVSLIDDLTLVGLARAGDRLAFGILYLRHHAAAWRVACIASRFSSDAELAVIEGFTRVFSALPAEPEGIEAGLAVTFRPYLLACVRQSALDRSRTAGRVEVEADRTGPGRGATTRPAASPPPPAALAGLTIDGEVRLAGLEHHVARGALAALPERDRTALWLTDVEAMTPGEVAGILGGPSEEMVELAAAARAELHSVQQAALDRQEVRADCRFSAEHLAAYEAGTLDPAAGLLVRAHLADCFACRMRQGELNNAPAALAAAVPAAPLLGGETQHHWLASVSALRPAERLLPPVLAAGGTIPRESFAQRTATHLGTVAGAAAAPARRLPDALRRAGRAAAGAWQSDSIDLTTKPPRHGAPRPPAEPGPPPDPARPAPPAEPARRPTGPGWPDSPGWTGSPGWSGSPVPSLPPGWTIPPRRAARRPEGRPRRRPGGVPQLVRRIRRTTLPVLPAMALAVAWVLVMMALPRLMTPSTGPGPGGLALPAVQAYLPDLSPGPRTSTTKPALTAPSGSVRGPSAGQPVTGPAGSLTESAAHAEPSFGLVAAASRPAAATRSGRPGSRAGVPPTSPPQPPSGPASTPPVAAAVAAAVPVIDLIPVTVTPQVVDPGTAAKAKKATKPAATRPEKVNGDKAVRDKAVRAKARLEKARRDKGDGALRGKAVRPGKAMARARIFTS